MLLAAAVQSRDGGTAPLTTHKFTSRDFVSVCRYSTITHPKKREFSIVLLFFFMLAGVGDFCVVTLCQAPKYQ
jgi:hypothetical protein